MLGIHPREAQWACRGGSEASVGVGVRDHGGRSRGRRSRPRPGVGAPRRTGVAVGAVGSPGVVRLVDCAAEDSLDFRAAEGLEEYGVALREHGPDGLVDHGLEITAVMVSRQVGADHRSDFVPRQTGLDHRRGFTLSVPDLPGDGLCGRLHQDEHGSDSDDHQDDERNASEEADELYAQNQARRRGGHHQADLRDHLLVLQGQRRAGDGLGLDAAAGTLDLEHLCSSELDD